MSGWPFEAELACTFFFFPKQHPEKKCGVSGYEIQGEFASVNIQPATLRYFSTALENARAQRMGLVGYWIFSAQISFVCKSAALRRRCVITWGVSAVPLVVGSTLLFSNLCLYWREGPRHQVSTGRQTTSWANGRSEGLRVGKYGKGLGNKCVQTKAILSSCLLKMLSYFTSARCSLYLAAPVCCYCLREVNETEQDNGLLLQQKCQHK